MNKADVKIGSMYKVKVSGVLAEVRITGKNPHGGWDGRNLLTNRKVRIKSAQRLRAAVNRPAKRKLIVTLAEHEAEVKASATAGEVAPSAKKARKATKDARAKTKPATGDPGATSRGPSGLDAAAQVLAETGTPMSAKDMVEGMLAKGIWKTNGKTPAATIYAAIIREIAAKGTGARFSKVERGKFELAK